MMEDPYMREREVEEEEENGMNLQTKRKSKLHHQNISNISYTSSDTSVITTELSNSSSFEHSSTVSSMEDYYTNNNSNSINGNNNTITNGEKPKINGVRSVKKNDEEAVEALSKADEKASFDETNKRDNYSNVAHQNQDSNGTTARQKGVGVIEYSFSENNGGGKETDIGSNTDAGLKNVGILLDESSSHVNVTSSEIYDTENTVRKIVVLNDQDEVVETSHSKDTEQEFEEYDVERVVEKQKTHDIICPNCKHCITDRVILKRRKRKTPEPYADISRAENPPPPDEQIPDDVDAISCFSCFRIFIPKGDGFLSWIIKPKPSVPLHLGDTPPEHKGPAELPPEDGAGSRFPLWILTCCQPTYSERPLPKPGQEPPLTPKDGTKDVGHKTGVSSPPPQEGQAPPDTQPFVPASDTKDVGHKIGVSSPPSQEGQAPPDTQPFVPAPGAKGQLPPTREPPRTPESGSEVPRDDIIPCSPSSQSQGTPVQPDPKPPLPHEGGSEVPRQDIRPHSPPLQSQDTPVQPDPKPSVHPEGGSPLWFLTCCQPKQDPKSPEKPEDHKVNIPGEQHLTSPVPQPNNRPATDLEATLLPHPPENRRPGVSRPDIIKAIVYGGLVECITSLSVITSAAGGDATTLNIVALGLANVAGGLVLLLHNLRVLIHEHTADRYQDQLGRRDHFLLHSVVAVISYLLFGLLSPVIYGFSFRLSDNKDYKLAALAAASLVCITVLSIGKAYVRRQAYIQTIFYYLSVGFMVSGVGYVAGDLINMLLKKLGVFDSSAPVAMPRLDAGFVDGAWSSY